MKIEFKSKRQKLWQYKTCFFENIDEILKNSNKDKNFLKKIIVRDKIENKINPFKMKIEFRR